MGIVSGQGGATGQRERVAELTLMAREQGRDVHITAADNRSRDFLAGDVRLAGETVTGKSALQDGTAFIPGGTLIVDQAEKLSLKETISCSMARCAITCRSCSQTAGSAAGPAVR